MSIHGFNCKKTYIQKNLDITIEILTFLSGFAISGNILQKGLITSKNLTETRKHTSVNLCTKSFFTKKIKYLIIEAVRCYKFDEFLYLQPILKGFVNYFI